MRLQCVIDELSSWDFDILLIENPIDLFYLTGVSLSKGKIIIGKNKALLVVDGRYYEQCKVNPLYTVVLFSNPSQFNELLSKEFASEKRLGFDSAYTSVKSYAEMQQDFSKWTLISIDSPIKKLRSIKDGEEIERLRQAGALGSLGFDFVVKHIKKGISEIELATELEIFWKRKGGKALAFEPIIAFGSNSALPHYRAGKKTLKEGDAILVDIGVNLEHYHSDMTRMIYFGEPNQKMLEIHAIVQHAQQEALTLCKEGITLGELDSAARSYIAKQGYEKNFTHSLGHGVGLEIHEEPLIRNVAPQKDFVLEKGMVITIEPGIYLPDIGGVRIEDTIAITETGYENLTNRSTDPLIM